jgi:hypothetical protein
VAHGGTGQVRLVDTEPDPGEVTDPLIAEWFLELVEGKRSAGSTMVLVERVRSNPFAPLLGEATVRARMRAVTSGQWEPELWVAALPSGAFVDVDTPVDCEVVKRARFKFVVVHVIGTLTEADCARIGIED